jgi:hypothetical protein
MKHKLQKYMSNLIRLYENIVSLCWNMQTSSPCTPLFMTSDVIWLLLESCIKLCTICSWYQAHDVWKLTSQTNCDIYIWIGYICNTVYIYIYIYIYTVLRFWTSISSYMCILCISALIEFWKSINNGHLRHIINTSH